MSYSRNFGMRSFENVVRDGRFRAPRTGTPIKIGAPVQLDPANPGFLKLAGAGAAPGPGAGIAVYEHIQNKSDALTTVYDAPYDSVPLGQYAQMMHGPGTKVWIQDTAAKTLYDGRVQAAGDLLDAGVTVDNTLIGKGLVPTADGKWRAVDADGADNVAGNADDEKPWMVVEQVNPSTGRVEARLTF